jgi:trimethylamine--corrinoid protein Co-methyltransferase
MSSEQRRGRRSGGRAGRQAARAARSEVTSPYLVRKLAPVDMLDEEGYAQIEENAEIILSEVGVAFQDYPDALALWRDAGADVDGELVRFPRGMCRQIVQENAPAVYTQHARNPERNVVIGADNTVFARNYGSPFAMDLDNGRRYASLQDFHNLVKLTYMLPHLHHSGGTVCEPVDLPVNKRHLDMVYAHIRYSDKPYMGSVTATERAADSIELSRIAFGGDLANRTVMTSLINASSPLRWDGTMLGAATQYARANQACIMSPFILAGAMSPVTVAGLARRLNTPFRSGGQFTSSKLPDAQAAYESASTLLPTVNAGVNFVLHAAGWLEGGLSVGYEKLIMDADQLGMMEVYARGIDMTANGQAMDAFRSNPHGQHYLGNEHTLANFEEAFYRSTIADNNSFEQWDEEGGLSAAQRASAQWKRMLTESEAPPLDSAIDEELQDYMARRKAEMPDAAY